MPPKLVLAAVDLGPSSELVLREAVRSAAGGLVLVCHVLPDLSRVHTLFPHLSLEHATARVEIQEAVRNQLRELAERHQGEPVLGEGEAYSTVVELARSRRVDLIVAGAPSAPSRFVAGTAERIARYAPCPVLVVRASPEGPVVAATDLSDPSLPALRTGADLATARGVGLIALHVIEVIPWVPPTAAVAAALAGSYVAPSNNDSLVAIAKGALARAVEALPGQPSMEVVLGEPAAKILEGSSANAASVIVVATHGRTGFERVLVGSVAESIVRAAHCSVLVARHAVEPPGGAQ